MAVTITVDAFGQNIFGQHLNHADFPGPSARCRARIQITVLNQCNCCQQLWTEQVRAAAIMCQCRQRVDRIEIPLHRAEIGFQCPESCDHLGRDTELLPCALKNGGISLHICSTVIHPIAADGALREFKESLFENALRSITRQNGLVNLYARKRRINRCVGIAHARSVSRHAIQKSAEIAATWHGLCGYR